jgi:23S rRNA (adenine2030-N6)-methyltransferase
LNYRHAFHAGNFADVMKHALLVRILVHLRRKETPFRVVDTHAGIGFYDLQADEAARTGEWQGGVARLDEPFGADVEDLLQPYRAVLADVRTRRGASVYPGSPAIIREMLRRDDRAIFLEMHPEDGELLSERFNEVATTKVMRLDGWVGLYGLIPPKERRGLVLIDPPYEETDELARAVPRLARAVEKWPTGIFAFWYPIKDRRETDGFAAALARAIGREALRLELLVDDPADRTRLNGSGLLVINPPWTLAEEGQTLLPALAERLARGRYGAYLCERMAQRN